MANKKKHVGFRSSWKDYFSFNNRVRRGLIVLFGLMTAEIIALVYLHYIPSSSGAVDIQQFKKEIDAFYASGTTAKDAEAKNADSTIHNRSEFSPDKPGEKPKRKTAELFNFNPNQLPEAEWKRLGFSDKQIRSIFNFEAKGGKFRTKGDVKKMYAISPGEFSRIEPYINLPDSLQKKNQYATAREPKNLIVDIGIADREELEKLPMVGEYLAEKICNYREKLGGFYDVEQVKEVRGMRDSTFMVIAPHLLLKDTNNLRRINLNTADFNEFNSHPYIDNAVSGLIISYRKQHGEFHQVEDLRKVALVDAELYRKIAPYLKVE
ncbi:MAG: helix-hairpin-helix domain-containing protein [Bacteroidetes bacterium]|nr:helix-hairpin-helix domain-containing protein [Bacteroidota bacterium]